MKNIINYIVIGILAVISSLYIFCTVSYASALPNEPLSIDPSEFTVLEGGGGAFDVSIPYVYNPDILGFGLDQLLTRINSDMYNKFGYDLQDASWYVEDIATENAHNYDVLTAQLSCGLYQTYNEALASGYMFFTHNVPQAWNAASNGAKQYILGKISDTTGNITNVFNNQLVPITNDYFDNYSDLFSEYVDTGVVNDFTAPSGMIYSKSFNSAYTDDTYDSNFIEFNKPVYFYSTNLTEGKNRVYAVYSGSVPKYVDGYKLNKITGRADKFVTGSISYWDSFTVNNIQYSYGAVSVSLGGRYWEFYSGEKLPTLEDVQNFLGSGNVDKPYLYQWGAESRIRQLLGRLNGYYVPSDNLSQIKQILEDTPVKPIFYPSPTPNGDPAVGAEPAPTDDFWDVLEGKIDEIIQSISDYQPYLPELPDTSTEPNPNPNPNPNPDPEPSPSDINTGIALPESFTSDIIRPFTDVLKLPFSFLSVFEPIFYMFNHSLLFPLWLLIPSIIVVCFIIWALK